jgi:hypothetical protein
VAAFGLDGGTFEMTGISATPFSTSSSCAVAVFDPLASGLYLCFES